MNKLSYIYGVLCMFLLWGCNTIDLSDVGYGESDRLKYFIMRQRVVG